MNFHKHQKGGDEMHITDIESIILQHDMEEELGFSQGYYKQRTAHLLKVHTDEGIIGIGEVFGAGPFAFANQAIINHVIKPLVCGRNPLDIGVIWHDVYNAVRDHGQKGLPICCLSGVDIALWDIFGKSTSQPLYQLLGGKARTQIAAYGYGMMFRKQKDLAAIYAAEVSKIVESGFTASKMKLGMGVQKDVELARAVRHGAGDGFKLMADTNHAYTVGEAIQLGQQLRDLDFYWFEEPVMPEDYQGYSAVRTALPGIHIAGGEAEWTRFGHRELLTRRCVDILQPEVAATGGISEFMRILSMAHAFGTPVIPHVWGSDVLIAVDMHLVSVIPDIPGGLHQFEPMLEYDTTPNLFHEQLLSTPLGIREQITATGGYVRPPEGPGIGIELNEDFIETYRVA
ncbi:MAG: mandelate racemase/muconate lactonizing enzyme family protein [Pirellulaceae bacterium]|nr:mandelate racemase/muconate lactonizing enzyme family protein [Pirellulaceae bacterium]